MNDSADDTMLLTDAQARRLIRALPAPFDLMGELMYGTGLRLAEVLQLRVKDVDAEAGCLYIRRVHGARDRFVAVPAALRSELRHQLAQSKRQHKADLRAGVGVILPLDVEDRLPLARTRWCWQYLFPSEHVVADPLAPLPARTHRPALDFQRRLQTAARRAKLAASVHSHSLRHAYAARLVEEGLPLAEIQMRLGHEALRTTALYARQVHAARTAPSAPVVVDRAWISHFEPERRPVGLLARLRALVPAH